jgi:alpha-L-arabinofuranosidase
MIKLAADYFDFVSYHWYPNHTNKDHADENGIHPHPKTIMANSLAVKMMVDRIDQYIGKHAPGRKGKIEVAFLEWDGSWDAAASDLNYSYQGMMWSLANAIFYADTLGQFALLGVPVANNYNYQEVMFGLIRGWDKDAGWGGDRWDGETIRPKALAMQLFAKHFGDVLVESQLKGSPVYYKGRDWRADSYIGEVPYVTAYASKDTVQNRLAIALINKHDSHAFSIRLSIKEALLEAQGKAWILNGPNLESQNDGHPRQVDVKQFDVGGIAPEFYVKLPAHSVMMIEIKLKESN